MALEILLGLLLLGAAIWVFRLRSDLAAERAYWQQRRSEQDRAALPPLFLATAAALESGLLLIDRTHRIRFANHAVADMFNTRLQQVEGEAVIAVLRDYQADALINGAIDNGETQSATIHLALSPQTLHVTCYPLADSEDYQAIVILRDVTHMAQLERARREMVANVSHELRTPLASIKLLVETLQQNPPPAVATRMLGSIDDELESMTHLVDELRELSQIESGRMVMTLQPQDLAAVVERAAARLRPQAARRQLDLHTEIEESLPPALLDAERIGQVLLNLLNNALKFTPAGGRVTLRVRCLAAQGVEPGTRVARELEQSGLQQALLLAVSDTGIGIPSQELNRVFERFYKVDRARTRNSGGTGLGLAIAKHLVERHGGRIWVESREGEGSTFSLLLPTA